MLGDAQDGGGGGSPGLLSSWLGQGAFCKLEEVDRSAIKLLDAAAPESPRGPGDRGEIGAGWGGKRELAPLIDLDDAAQEPPHWEHFGAPAGAGAATPQGLQLHRRTPSSESIMVRSPVTHQRAPSSGPVAVKCDLSRALGGHPPSEAGSLQPPTPRPAPMRQLAHQLSLPAHWHAADPGTPRTPAPGGGRLQSAGSLPARFSGPLPEDWFAPGPADVPAAKPSLSQRGAIFDSTWSAAAANLDPCAEVIFNSFAEFSRDVIPPPKARAGMRWLQPWAEGGLAEGQEAPQARRE